MGLVEAFLSPSTGDLFRSIAASGDAREVAEIDVESGQSSARKAIQLAIDSALGPRSDPGSRIALIYGEAGSGKSHVLTSMFRRTSSRASAEVYPIVLQLTAPVSVDEYPAWLVDATFRELAARHFTDDTERSPLRRLAAQLLDICPVEMRERFDSSPDDFEEGEEFLLAQKLAYRIRRAAMDLLNEDPPSDGFLAAILLAASGDSAAMNYLRHGDVDERLKKLGLREPDTPHKRIDMLKSLALSAQIVGAGLVFGFDQIENAVRLGSEAVRDLALTQAVRLAEAMPNAAIVIAMLSSVLPGEAMKELSGLANSDRDRIERESPWPVYIERGDAAFNRSVIAHRLARMRARAKLGAADEASSLEPLPAWFIPEIEAARSARHTLRLVNVLRELAIGLGRIPRKSEYAPPPPHAEHVAEMREASDFSKEWADYLDNAPKTAPKFLGLGQAALLAWWAEQAVLERLGADRVEVQVLEVDGAAETPVVDILIKDHDGPLVRRAVALCREPNGKRLADELESFLKQVDACPFVLRKKPFPKSKAATCAASLRQIEDLSGDAIHFDDTAWHAIERARDFAEKHADDPTFLQWRREERWLQRIAEPLAPLVALPDGYEFRDQTLMAEQAEFVSELGSGSQASKSLQGAPFPLFIGQDKEGGDIYWDPYRPAPHHLNNFSFLVTGDSGAGKTQTIKVLLDAVAREELPLIIFDFKADYCNAEFTEPLGIKVIDVGKDGLPFNPMQPSPEGAAGARPTSYAFALSSVLKRIFRLGAVQEARLKDAILAVYRDIGVEPRDWVQPETVDWPPFELVLERLSAATGNESLINKLSLLVELGLFLPRSKSMMSFEQFLSSRVCLRLSDLPSDELKSALAEILIIQIHGHAVRGDQPRKLARMMVFDEAHRVKDSEKLEALAREGRAFGVGIVIGTQFPGDIPETMAGNLATQLFLMNNQAAHRQRVVRQVTGTVTSREARDLLNKVASFAPLDALFDNPHHKCALLRVKPYYERRNS